MTHRAAGLNYPVNSRTLARRRDEFETLIRMLAKLRNPWQLGASGFEVRAPLRALEGIGGSLIYKVHTIGWAERRMRFFANVTIWPRSDGRKARGRTRTADGRVERVCRAACDRTLRENGYRGKWHRTPWGKFGDYWKPLATLRHLYAEIRLYESWMETPPWGAAP